MTKEEDPFHCPFYEKGEYCSYYCDDCNNHPECDWFNEE